MAGGSGRTLTCCDRELLSIEEVESKIK